MIACQVADSQQCPILGADGAIYSVYQKDNWNRRSTRSIPNSGRECFVVICDDHKAPAFQQARGLYSGCGEEGEVDEDWCKFEIQSHLSDTPQEPGSKGALEGRRSRVLLEVLESLKKKNPNIASAIICNLKFDVQHVIPC